MKHTIYHANGQGEDFLKLYKIILTVHCKNVRKAKKKLIMDMSVSFTIYP